MSHIPSQLLKIWSVAIRWLLTLVVITWLLAGATWGVLHWLIVPRISEFRPQLEIHASRAVGMPVRIGEVTARSNGLMPSFELANVALLDSEGRVALSLPRVLVSLSPRSVWRLGFEQIYLDSPRLDMRRLPDGRIVVAGLDMAAGDAANSAALDWFFSQIEFVIHDGVLRWTDEQRGAASLILQQVNVVARNSGHQHQLQLDATPPQGWGQRFSLRGHFSQPLLARKNGQWRDWDGHMYATFDQVDLSELRQYLDMGVDVRQGRGALRAWVDVKQGQVVGATADVALSEVDVTLDKDLLALDLQGIQGRVGARVWNGGFEVSGTALSFDSRDGLHWPGGNVRLLYVPGNQGRAAHGELQADKLDLAALSQLVRRLPVPDALHNHLLAYAPKGLAEKLSVSWQGTPNQLQSYAAKGSLSQLDVTAVAPFPGVRGLRVDFELDQQAGRADLHLDNGIVDVPEVFQDRRIEFAKFSTQARWQIQGEHLAVQFSDMNFSNADAQGQAQVKWETSDPSKSISHSRFPGVLDVQASLSRVVGARVYRYLPLGIDERARDYVRDAITAGQASNVRFDIRGDIAQLPMVDSRHGAFRISADVQNATMAYVPHTLQTSAELAWPVLSNVSGKLLFDQMQLHVKDVQCHVQQAPAVQVTQADVLIQDLRKTEVRANVVMKGPLKDALGVVNSSPIGGLIGDALVQSTASGQVDIKLDLNLPVAQLKKSTVQGRVIFGGNSLQLSPNSPKLTRTRGQLDFNQSGLSLSGVQARMLGGDVVLDGGLILAAGSNQTRAASNAIRAVGTATAEGLRQASELGLVPRLARSLIGSAGYTASLGVREGQLEWLVQSSLQGLTSNLPAPFEKSADVPLALRVQSQFLSSSHAVPPVSGVQQRFSVTLGNVGRAVYEGDLSVSPRGVVRGRIDLGTAGLPNMPLPSQGVSANVEMSKLDLDAWKRVLTNSSSEALLPGATGIFDQDGAFYLPTTLALRTDVLTVGDYQVHKVLLAGTREGSLWHAKMDAREISGDIEYRQGLEGSAATNAGRLYARLARLIIPPSVAPDVESLLDAQPASIPALDIVVDDFEIHGKAFGRLEVEAINRMAGVGAAGVPEWRLNKFNLIVPEAKLTSSGNWTKISAQNDQGRRTSVQEHRRTVLNFKLDVADGGALLARLGMKDVVRQGSGKLEGQVAWMGEPLKIDYPTLSGAFTVNVASGQFLKADPGIAKLFGVLSLQALPRRLTLDFRDVFSDGFAFDFLRGDVSVDRGVARTNNLQMKGVNAAVLMEGQADVARETQDLKVVVIPEINAGTASLIATVINPAVGLGSVLAQLFLRRPLIESNTKEFHVTGNWSDPQVAEVAKLPESVKGKKP